jgi:hypothetical protein
VLAAGAFGDLVFDLVYACPLRGNALAVWPEAGHVRNDVYTCSYCDLEVTGALDVRRDSTFVVMRQLDDVFRSFIGIEAISVAVRRAPGNLLLLNFYRYANFTAPLPSASV